MIRGLYIATSGMIAQQRRQENAANNIANIETPSFKKQTLNVSAGKAMEILKNQGNECESLGKLELRVGVEGVVTDFSQGILKETGRPEDLAIDGQGYFKMELLSGEPAYTRNGSVHMDSSGFLRNTDGFVLCGRKRSGSEAVPMQVEDKDFEIDKAGNILDADGNRLYTLPVVDFEDRSVLKEVATGVYVIRDGAESNEADAENSRVVAGVKESSNVNALDEMVKLMEISRSFESNQRVIQSMDETLGLAVNEIAKL